MSQNTETVPFRTKLRVAVSNFLQKHRTLLLGIVIAGALLIVAFAVWTQIDASSKNDFAAKIEKSQGDYTAWAAENDAAKKTELAKTLEAELAEIQKAAPAGYGLSKAWFLQGKYLSAQSKWAEAAKAYYTVFEKDRTSYLAPIALVNSAVSHEEAGNAAEALKIYEEFEKHFAGDTLLAPQVFFTQGRLLESQQKTPDALAAYKKLLDKYPEAGWTKLGRDRILLLSSE